MARVTILPKCSINHLNAFSIYTYIFKIKEKMFVYFLLGVLIKQNCDTKLNCSVIAFDAKLFIHVISQLQ